MNRRTFFGAIAGAPLVLVAAEMKPVSRTIRVEGIDASSLFTGEQLRHLLERLRESMARPVI